MKQAAAVTALILETFRLNGRLLAAGDALVESLNLTSARWQVLGAIATAPVPLSVAQIARSMGLTRQAVQRLANDMERDGLLRFAANPNHRRAGTSYDSAWSALAAAMKRQGLGADPYTGALGATDHRGDRYLETTPAALERDDSGEGLTHVHRTTGSHDGDFAGAALRRVAEQPARLRRIARCSRNGYRPISAALRCRRRWPRSDLSWDFSPGGKRRIGFGFSVRSCWLPIGPTH
jgi:DNA-binding Lrp family transcriptional regulator